MSAKTVLGWGAAFLVLLAVFGLYMRPEILVMLTDQLWACFN